jgi:arginine N-succinyltransferase
VCAIKAAVGLNEPFYNYRIGTLVHSSRELNVFSRMDTLYLSNDLTGSSELCSLFLRPEYRTGYNGKWLSKSRFLFIAQFQQLFTEKIIAEMRGFQDEGGTSPFYEGLGRHFFKMDFNHVDGLTALGKKSFIAELMPRQPLYVAYLPQDAQDVIGQVHRSTLPARKLLEQEGMHYEGYIDIFDAGPVLQGRVAELRAVRDSVLALAEEGRPGDDTEHVLVSNTSLSDFRMVLAQAVPGETRVALSAQELSQLHCQEEPPCLTCRTTSTANGKPAAAPCWPRSIRPPGARAGPATNRPPPTCAAPPRPRTPASRTGRRRRSRRASRSATAFATC